MVCELDRQIRDLAQECNSPDEYLRQLTAVLNAPQQVLTVTPICMRLNWRGVKLAQSLRRRQVRAGTDADHPSRALETLGFTLAPMHPETTDQDLERYFVVAVPDRDAAQAVIDGLSEMKAIEAAYLKPTTSRPRREGHPFEGGAACHRHRRKGRPTSHGSRLSF